MRKSFETTPKNAGPPVFVSVAVATATSVTLFSNVPPPTYTLPAVDAAGWLSQTMQFFVVPPACERPLIPVVSPESTQL